MGKITNLPQALSFDEGDVLVKDGENGTKQIPVSEAAKYMGRDTIMVNEQPTEGTKVVIQTTDQEYSLALMSDVDAVDDKVEEVKTQLNFGADTLGFAIFPSVTKGYYISKDGVITASTETWEYTDPIKLEKGCSIKAYARGYSVNIAIISTCDSDGSNISPVTICLDDVRREYSYTTKEDCYVIVSGNNPAIDPGPTTISISKQSDLTIEKEIFHGSVTPGYYINAEGVETQSSGGWDITEYMSVAGANAITYSGLSNVGSNNVCSAWYDSTKTLLSGGVFKQTTGSVTLQVPQGAFYVRFTVGDFEKSNFSVISIADPKYLSTNDWSNTTWALIGDSLTEKNYRATYSYYDYIKDDTGINLINKGQSGGGYARGNAFYQEISALENEYFNFATFFGSGNDCNWQEIFPSAESWEVALGDVTDTGTTTICGYINRAIDRYYNLFPLKKLGIITPTPWNAYSNSDGTINGTQMDDYTNKLIQICKMRGIPCLDLYHESGMRPWNADFRLEYYNENGVQDTGTHPNSKGHKWFYKMVFEFIDQFLI